MPKKKKQTDLRAPNAYLEQLAGNLDYEETSAVSFEDSVVRQYCKAINMPDVIRDSFKQGKWLTFQDIEDYMSDNFEIILDDTKFLKLDSVWKLTANKILKNYWEQAETGQLDLLIVNDNSFKQYRGTAILSLGNTGIGFNDFFADCVYKYDLRTPRFVLARPFDMFIAMVNSGLISLYETS